MKFTAKIICCGVALVWMHSAAAEEAAQASLAQTPAVTAAADPSAATSDDLVAPTPPAPRITVAPRRETVDKAKIEKRMDERSARTSKRTAEAEKDVAERATQQQRQTSNTRH